ncbi:hypothetical protein LBMAG42_20490 [Deltaproteobacteria bacterium]|nr:hypothetical protein LBMAG42_20490 [Deltaproteobacteria bacterium]
MIGICDHPDGQGPDPEQRFDHALLPSLEAERFALDRGGRIESIQPQFEARRPDPYAKTGFLSANGRRRADSEGLEQLHVGPERAG